MNEKNGIPPVENETVVHQGSHEQTTSLQVWEEDGGLPMLQPSAVVEQVNKIKETMELAMEAGVHYGVIAAGQKPTLLKGGAEKLNLLFRLRPVYDIRRTDYKGGHREYEVVCSLFHIVTGTFLGQGVGSCSTMEKKYRYRHDTPEDTGKPVPKNYWKVRDNEPAKALDLLGGKGFIAKKNESNQWTIHRFTGKVVENPDIADVYNTVKKMAKKRAHVDATLTVTAASDIFTQDLEDMDETLRPSGQEVGTQQAEPKKSAKKADKKTEKKAEQQPPPEDGDIESLIEKIKQPKPEKFSTSGDLIATKRMCFWLREYHMLLTSVDLFTTAYFQSDQEPQGYRPETIANAPLSAIAFLKKRLEWYAKDEGIDEFDRWLKEEE